MKIVWGEMMTSDLYLHRGLTLFDEKAQRVHEIRTPNEKQKGLIL